MRYDATLRNIELIGEASTHVPPEVRALAPGLPWRDIIGTRNRLAQAYLGIDADARCGTSWPTNCPSCATL